MKMRRTGWLRVIEAILVCVRSSKLMQCHEMQCVLPERKEEGWRERERESEDISFAWSRRAEECTCKSFTCCRITWPIFAPLCFLVDGKLILRWLRDALDACFIKCQVVRCSFTDLTRTHNNSHRHTLSPGVGVVVSWCSTHDHLSLRERERADSNTLCTYSHWQVSVCSHKKRQRVAHSAIPGEISRLGNHLHPLAPLSHMHCICSTRSPLSPLLSSLLFTWLGLCEEGTDFQAHTEGAKKTSDCSRKSRETE